MRFENVTVDSFGSGILNIPKGIYCHILKTYEQTLKNDVYKVDDA